MFKVSSDKKLLQIERIHQFLSTQTYWCLGIPKETVLRAIEGSLCWGVYTEDNVQVGFARVITDRATFAWLADVYIEEPYRGKGLSQLMLEAVMKSPELQGLRRFLLATKDAHGVYEKLGFQLTKTPGYWMEIKNNQIYQGS
jgi:GNAT superfamily N-acetyltransferase